MRNNRQKSKLVAIVSSFTVSFILLFIAFRGINFTELGSQLVKVNLSYTPLLLLVYVLTFLVRAFRWSFLLPNRKKLSLNELFQITILGMFANLVLPLRAGEVVRPWILSKRQPVSFSAGLASIFTERMFDILAVLAILALSLTEIQSPPALVILGARALGIFALLVISLMIVAYCYPNLILIPAQIVLKRFFSDKNSISEKLKTMIEEFVSGLRIIASMNDLVVVIISSLMLWGLIGLLYQIFLWSFGEFPSFWVGMTINSMIALAVAAPSAPGFIGTFQFGCFVALTIVYNFPPELAAAYSIVSHAFQFVFTIVAGLLILSKRKIRLGQVAEDAAAG